MQYNRYSVYVTLPHGPLAQFCAAWLGWNAATGEWPEAPQIDGLPLPAHDITATPRKYGLHGTVKPPFKLAEGTCFEGLQAAFQMLCAGRAPIQLDGLHLSRLGSFLALTPVGQTTDLSATAAAVVETLDPFRAPPSAADLARRRKARLSPRQDALLVKWGYPYVFEEFRFHITLTGRLKPEALQQVSLALRPHIEPHLPQPFVINALTLCGEDQSGQFHELQRCTLAG
jgi:hypothetical protein